MKKGIAIVLSSIIFSLATIDVVTVLTFMTQREYITQNLCVNVEKEEMNCRGKCYLMQKLEETKNSEKDNLPLPTLKKIEPIEYISALPLFLNILLERAPNSLNAFCLVVKGRLFTHQVFHPPQSVCT